MKPTTTAFEDGKPIPKVYTGEGRDVSPPLHWGDAPENTRSLALICEDPDAPRGTFTHWVLFNLPAQTRDLREAVPAEKTLPSGGVQGVNDFGKIGYKGPMPPPGKPHRYYFKLYALDATLDLTSGATRAHLLEAMKGHILGHGEIMGTYAR